MNKQLMQMEADLLRLGIIGDEDEAILSDSEMMVYAKHMQSHTQNMLRLFLVLETTAFFAGQEGIEISPEVERQMNEKALDKVMGELQDFESCAWKFRQHYFTSMVRMLKKEDRDHPEMLKRNDRKLAAMMDRIRAQEAELRRRLGETVDRPAGKGETHADAT